METLTWDAVTERIDTEAKQNFDFMCPPKLMRMGDDGVLCAYDTEKNTGMELGFNDIGLSQLATKLGIPSQYARKLANRSGHGDPELLAANVNHWLKTLDQDQKLLVRGSNKAAGPVVRAMLSDRYGILDNHEFTRAAIEGFKRNGLIDKLDIQDLWLTDSTFHVRLTNKAAAFDAAKAYHAETRPGTHGFVNKEGDPDFLFPMLHLSNSEVGHASIKLEGGVYRVKCTNGLIEMVSAESQYRRRHFGFSLNELTEYVVAKAEGIVRNASKFTEQFALTQNEIVENPLDVIERLAAKHKGYVSKAAEKAIVNELGLTVGNEVPVTKYELVNAVTAVARESRNPEVRLDLERVAAKLITRN